MRTCWLSVYNNLTDFNSFLISLEPITNDNINPAVFWLIFYSLLHVHFAPFPPPQLFIFFFFLVQKHILNSIITKYVLYLLVPACGPNFLVPLILFKSTNEVFEDVRTIALSVFGILCQVLHFLIICATH